MPRGIPAFLILLCLLLSLGSCGETVHEVTVKRVSEYHHAIHQSGLSASVDPLIDEERIVNHFGANLLADGLLPVFVVIENQGYSDGIVLVKEKISLEMRKTAVREGSERYKSDSEVSATTTRSVGDAAAVASSAASVAIPIMASNPVISIALLPVTLAVSMQADKTARVARRVEEKAITFRTIYPGQVHSGFVYFKLVSRNDTTNLVAVTLPVQNLNTREIVPLRFAMDIQR